MNSTAWKWVLTVTSLLAASASFAAGHAGTRHPIEHATHHQRAVRPLDKSKFTYMDSAPVYNTHHVRAAVMVFEKKPEKNRCAALTGQARYHCYELAMPT